MTVINDHQPAPKVGHGAGTLSGVLQRLLVMLVVLALASTACGQVSTTETAITEPTRDIATTTAIPIPTEIDPTATSLPPTATAQPTVAPTPIPTLTPQPIPTPTTEPVAEADPAPLLEPAPAAEAALEAASTDESLGAADESGGAEGTSAEEEGPQAAGGQTAGDVDDTTSAPADNTQQAKPAGQGVLPAAYALSSLQAVACPAGAQDAAVSCYFARTPAAANNPSADTMVDLMVSVVDNGDPSGIGPVFYLQGGPGIGSVQYSDRYVGLDHDVVLVDQRGTGSSIPKLGCGEVDDLWVAERTNEAAVRLDDVAGTITIVDAYVACVDRLKASGVDLNLFDTTNAANDFALVRQLLGYSEWSIWGVSYGTRLGLTIMRDHPQALRAAVLDSVVPFEVDFFATVPENGLRSMTAVTQACNASACGTTYGDFLSNLGALAQRLDQDPVVLTVTRPSSGQQFAYRVNGKELLAMVFTQLYSTERLRSLPRQIAAADYGGLEEIVVNYVRRRDPEAFDLSLGAYYATWCSEEYPFYDHTRDDALLAQTYGQFGTGFALALSSDGVANVCSKFNVRRSSSTDNTALTSPIPTLVMAGSLDPITPPAWSRQVADALTTSYYVELADHGHGMTGACTAGIRLQFLINPNLPPDNSCAVSVGSPTFE